jgi:two-component system cell cycle sensor histidine kinase/response regulator CckA
VPTGFRPLDRDPLALPSNSRVPFETQTRPRVEPSVATRTGWTLALLRRALDSCPTPAFVCDERFDILIANHALMKGASPFSRRDDVGRILGCLDLAHSGGSCGGGEGCGECTIRRAVASTLRRGELYRGVMARLPVFRDGEKRTVLLSIWTERVQIDHKPLALIWCADITSASEREEELHRSHMRFLGIVEKLPEGVLVIGDKGEIRFANTSASQFFATPKQQLVGRVFRHRPIDGEKALVNLRDANGEPRIAELRVVDTHWENRPASLALLRDVTEQRNTEDALRRSERRYRGLFDNSVSGVVVLSRSADGEPTVEALNRAALELEELEEDRAVGQPLSVVLPELDSRRVRPFLDALEPNGEVVSFGPHYCENARRPGWRSYRFYQLASGETVLVYEDVTEEKDAERTLHQAQKMEAIGKLAGGVAHEFNNLLQTLMGGLDLLRTKSEAADRDKLVSTLEARIRHGAALVRQLTLFGRREIETREALRLDSLVKDSGRLLRRIVRENVAFSVRTSDGALWVEADRGQIEQIIVNLVTNAVDAMPRGGELALTTGRRHGRAALIVEDSGEGIPEEMVDRIFEPFFTTKGQTGGAGLGLAVVHGIVEAHGGTIEIEAREEGGTRFAVLLPIEEAPTLATPDAGVADEGALETIRCARVLLVEDEEGPRETMSELLSLLGHEVTAATTAEEAIELSESRCFDVVVTDYMLPGRDGCAMAASLRRRWPALGVVVMSGYAEDGFSHDDAEASDFRFIKKPFDVRSLARVIDGVLDDSSPRASGRRR